MSEKSEEIIKESASTRWYLQNSLCRKFAKEKQKPAAERMTTKKTNSGTHPPPTHKRNRRQAIKQPRTNKKKNIHHHAWRGRPKSFREESRCAALGRRIPRPSRNRNPITENQNRHASTNIRPSKQRKKRKTTIRTCGERKNNEARKKRSLPSGKHGANH